MASAPKPVSLSRRSRLGESWVALSLALAVHIVDEALTGFLDVYNPTVAALRARWSWFPMPTFQFRTWLIGLICAVIILLVLSPLFFRNVRWIRPLGYFAAFIQISNALGHTLGTIMGRTVTTVHFPRPAPGFYSSPLLFICSIWLLMELARTKQVAHSK